MEYNSFKQGDLHPKSFKDVIDNAIARDPEGSRRTVAERWRSTPESLYRWQNNTQSPKFHDLCEMVRYMSEEERADLKIVLFGPSPDAAAAELARREKIDLVQKIRDSAELLGKKL